MVLEILALARLLNVNDGALLRIAGDVAHNAALRTVSDLTRGQRLELLLFLQSAAVAEGKLPKIAVSRSIAA